MDTQDFAALDRQVLWHPFTQQQGWEDDEPPVLIERGDGTMLFDADGRAYIDGVSSLWCNVHGHRHPTIDAAIHNQVDRVAHTTMLGLSHRPGVELAARLVALAPRGLSRVFYSDSGSTAVEIALKMAFQHWSQRGERQRTKFVCLRNAYHGDTIGSVSVGGIDLFHSMYRPLLFDAYQVAASDVVELLAVLRDHGDEIAAVVVEPLVQGAAGILMQPEGYLREVRAVTSEHGIPLIADEVATGFGRTGTMFACSQEGVAPDFLCLGKGLTGGYLPLAATLTTEAIYAAFLGEFSEFKTFFHGHTFTGNPLGCAAGIACLDVFEEERTLERLQPKIALLASLLDREVAPLPGVAEVRQRGFMVGIELTEQPLAARMGHQVTLAARRRGVLIRPLGDVVVLMPPLSIDAAELRLLVEITAAAIAEATEATGETELPRAA